MKIQILFFGQLKDVFGVSRSMEIFENASIRDAIGVLCRETGDGLPNDAALLYAVNQRFETDEKILRDQDELALMTPMSGG